MRKRDAVQKLKKIIQDWDGCMIDTKAAREILERIEKEIGMAPPNTKGYAQLPVHEWTKDRKCAHNMEPAGIQYDQCTECGEIK